MLKEWSSRVVELFEGGLKGTGLQMSGIRVPRGSRVQDVLLKKYGKMGATLWMQIE